MKSVILRRSGDTWGLRSRIAILTSFKMLDSALFLLNRVRLRFVGERFP